jgi:hypothetical protein
MESRSVTIVSVIRLNYLLKGDVEDPDITWNFVDIGLWSVVEANIAMVCGKYQKRSRPSSSPCLPSSPSALSWPPFAPCTADPAFAHLQR